MIPLRNCKNSFGLLEFRYLSLRNSTSSCISSDFVSAAIHCHPEHRNRQKYLQQNHSGCSPAKADSCTMCYTSVSIHSNPGFCGFIRSGVVPSHTPIDVGTSGCTSPPTT
jgi:hypothetical protein